MNYATRKSDEQRAAFAARANEPQSQRNMETALASLKQVREIERAWSQSNSAEQARERLAVAQRESNQSQKHGQSQ